MSTPVSFLIMHKGSVGFQVDTTCSGVVVRIREKGYDLASSWNMKHEVLSFNLMTDRVHTPEFMDSDIGRDITNRESEIYTVSVLHLGVHGVMWERYMRNYENRKYVSGDTISFTDLTRIPDSEECVLFCEHASIPNVDKQMLIGALGANATREQIDRLVAERHIGNGHPIIWYDLQAIQRVLGLVQHTKGEDNRIECLVKYGETCRIGPDIKPEEEVKVGVEDSGISATPSWDRDLMASEIYDDVSTNPPITVGTAKEDTGACLVREDGTVEKPRFSLLGLFRNKKKPSISMGGPVSTNTHVGAVPPNVSTVEN